MVIKIITPIVRLKMRSFLYILLAVGIGCNRAPFLERDFELHAGAHDRISYPIKIQIPEEFRDARNLSLVNSNTNQTIPVQKLSADEFCFLLDQPLKAGEKRLYKLQRSEKSVSPSKAHIDQNNGAISVSVGTKEVLRYHMEEVMPPEGNPAYYRKSGFIHPIFSPGGQIITEGFPEGHMHQHGFFFAWVNTVFEGRTPDFWNQHQQSGRVDHESVVDTTSGPVFATFSTTLIHKDISGADGPKNVLNETWTIRVYALEELFLFDLESVQSCATDSPLVMPAYRYGGMGIRANSQWFEGEGTFQDQEVPNRQGVGQGGFLTSEGRGRIEGNHTRPYWVQMDGKIDGVPVGMVSMGHPDNFRYPQPVRIHPSMPYFCFAPMVVGDFAIEPGKSYHSQYRFLVFNGNPDQAMIDRLWRSYSEPAELVWK